MDPDPVSPAARAGPRGSGGLGPLAGDEVEALESLLLAGLGRLRRAARRLDARHRDEAERRIRDFERDLARTLPRLVGTGDRGAGLERVRALLLALVKSLRSAFRGDPAATEVLDSFARRSGSRLDALARDGRGEGRAVTAPRSPAPPGARVELSTQALERLAPSEAPGPAASETTTVRAILERVLALFGPAAPWRERLRRSRRRTERPAGNRRRRARTGDHDPDDQTGEPSP